MRPPPRLATPADLLAVEHVVRAAYTPYIDRIGRPPGPMGDDYAALIAAGRVHVVPAAGPVHGVLVLLPQPDAMLLDNVAVAPQARGTGLGRLLLQHAERLAEAAGYRSIRLYTHALMTENVALYARIGYAETHRVREKGFDRVYMVKTLA